MRSDKLAFYKGTPQHSRRLVSRPRAGTETEVQRPPCPWSRHGRPRAVTRSKIRPRPSPAPAPRCSEPPAAHPAARSPFRPCRTLGRARRAGHETAHETSRPPTRRRTCLRCHPTGSALGPDHGPTGCTLRGGWSACRRAPRPRPRPRRYAHAAYVERLTRGHRRRGGSSRPHSCGACQAYQPAVRRFADAARPSGVPCGEPDAGSGSPIGRDCHRKAASRPKAKPSRRVLPIPAAVGRGRGRGRTAARLMHDGPFLFKQKRTL